MKPRIFLNMHWYCLGDGIVGIGATPEQAYDEWLWQMEMADNGIS